MKTPGRNRFAYNAQVVVDAAQSVITASEVVSEQNDEHQLCAMMAAAQATTGQVATETVADTGYSTPSELAQAAAESTSTVYASLPVNVQNREQTPYHCSRFEWVPERDVVRCPQGRELKFHHRRQRGTLPVRVYRDQRVCADCPVRGQCTQDRHGRSIDIAPYWGALQEHRTRMETESARHWMRRRGSVIERIFGHIKAHWNFQRWSSRGLANARAQWSLLCSTWNLTRIFGRWQTTPGLFGHRQAPA